MLDMPQRNLTKSPPPRIYVLILLLLFFLAPIAVAQSLALSPIIATNQRPRSMGFIWRPASPSDVESYEARLGSDGDWVDVGSAVRQSGKNFYYDFTGLSPGSEYTFYLRATGSGNTGATVSTITAATDFDARPCKSGGELKVIFSGLNSPGNAVNSFAITAEVYPGQSPNNDRIISNYRELDRTTREFSLGQAVPGMRYQIIVDKTALGNINQGLAARREVFFFGEDPLPACPSRASNSRDDDDEPPKPTATPIRDTLNHLPPSIQVNNWVDGAQGQQVDAVSVGRADVIPHHEIINAVNIWSYVTPGIEVCFDQPGRLLFVDSVYPPVDPVSLPAYQREGMTCATIDSAGTVVLLRSHGGAPSAQSIQPAQPNRYRASHSQALSDCEVRPWANLKFRHSPPDGSVRGVTSVRDWLPASEKRHGYFKVRLWDVDGWISGDYVATRGDCG